MTSKTNWSKLTDIVKQILINNPTNFLTAWETKKNDISQLLNKTRKLKDKNLPKRPQSAYIFFCKLYRPTLIKNNPNLQTKDVMRELGSVWKELTPQEKTKFEKLRDEDKTRYENEMTTYSGTTAVTVKEPKPRKSSNYNNFCKRMRTQVANDNPDFKTQDVTRELGRLWKEMSDDEKDNYSDKSEQPTTATVVKPKTTVVHKPVTGVKRKVAQEEDLFDE